MFIGVPYICLRVVSCNGCWRNVLTDSNSIVLIQKFKTLSMKNGFQRGDNEILPMHEISAYTEKRSLKMAHPHLKTSVLINYS
ncbi:hypothetical protein T05_2022 [Trichinella murrelli]|uniref:Uncharacterized protein n=1 Tax=Trichinella murrelli TaxID=144512 RepID=A0A0V0T8Q2_9BILA|nr:hypothetical protein T05_2022 [Trichinella murrelli]